MILEDKENMWTSNLLKKSNNDNSAVVVAFASNNNIKNIKLSLSTKSPSFIRSCRFLTLKDLYITKNFES